MLIPSEKCFYVYLTLMINYKCKVFFDHFITSSLYLNAKNVDGNHAVYWNGFICIHEHEISRCIYL